jgi:hypothetical protein
VVDIGVQRTLDALVERDGDVLLASHDADFLPQIDRLLTGDRFVGLVGFHEFVNSQYAGLYKRGLKVFDLEDNVRAFNVVLPRVRIITLADFDPIRFLGDERALKVADAANAGANVAVGQSAQSLQTSCPPTLLCAACNWLRCLTRKQWEQVNSSR